MRLLAPAKINLHLRVGPLCNSGPSRGFHPVLTWMTTVGLFDTLTLERRSRAADRPDPAAASAEMSTVTSTGKSMSQRVRFSCDDPTLPTDSRNLVVRAAERLLEAHEDVNAALDIALEKRIPAGAGLGGGSSDAARALLGVRQLLDLRDARELENAAPAKLSAPALNSLAALASIAATLGSDVPFFLFGPSSVCSGRGEIVQSIARPVPQWAVLILPEVHVATPGVYRRLDEMRRDDARVMDSEMGGATDGVTNAPDWNAWSAMASMELLPLLVNDLEAPAFSIEPKLSDLRSAAESALGRTVRMSGSGSSLFTLFDDREEAVEAADRARQMLRVRCEAVELAPPIDDDLMS